MSPELAETIERYLAALQGGDREAAREAVEEAVAIAPGTADAWGCRGEFYRYYEVHLEESLRCFERASALDPTSPLGPSSCAGVLEELCRLEEAEQAWGEAIRRSPGHPDPRRARARLREQRGDFSGALLDLSEAARLAPAEVDAHCERGEVLLQRWELEAAERAFRRALRVGRGYPRAQAGRSIALGALGDLAGANASRAEAQGELRELAAPAGARQVKVRYRCPPGQDPARLEALAGAWLGCLEPALGEQLHLWCGWALEVREVPEGLLLAEFDLERGTFRDPVLRPEVTRSLLLEARGMAWREQEGLAGWRVDLTQSARICPNALGSGQDLRLRRVQPRSARDSGWRVGPLDSRAFARATARERFGTWPPLLLVVEEVERLLPYLTAPPGVELELRDGSPRVLRRPRRRAA